MKEYPNWFENTAINNFKEFLKPYKGKDNLKFLQLGAFTGDASKWLLENIISQQSTLFDVDTWQGSNEKLHKDIEFDDVENVYDQKLSGYSNFVKFKGRTIDFFYSDYAIPETFDFIYVDADHTAMSVMRDAAYSFDLLKSGGILAFDDYTWGTEDLEIPRRSIDAFGFLYSKYITVLTVGEQVWVKKK